MEKIPNTKIVKVTSWLAIPADMQGEDAVGTQWAKVLSVTSEDMSLVRRGPPRLTTVVTETAHLDEPVLVEETTTEKPKKRGRPKGSKNRKSKTAKRTKKAMKDLKKNKRVFTGALYGWNATKDGSLVPNWKEQNNLDWMKAQIKHGVSASAAAKVLNALKIGGKRGGKWNSSSVLRTTRNKFHNSRDEKEAPKWFKNRKTLKLKI
jgi:hypothetical protein